MSIRLMQFKRLAWRATMLMIAVSIWGCSDMQDSSSNAWVMPVTPRHPDAPEVGEKVVWRPAFDAAGGGVRHGQTVASGFAIKVSADDLDEPPASVFLTVARQFSSPSPSQHRSAFEVWCNSVEAVSVSDAFGATDSVIPMGALYCDQTNGPATAASLASLDVAVIGLGSRFKPTALPLSTIEPAVGDRLWLVAAVYQGASASQKCHAASVARIDDDGRMFYEFENKELSMRSTPGAPLLDDAGTIVGIHLSGDDQDSQPLRFGIVAGRFMPLLRELVAGRRPELL